MSKNYWIVTSHKFAEHSHLHIAEGERDRLAKKHPLKKFEVRRCKRDVTSNADSHAYIERLETQVGELNAEIERLREAARGAAVISNQTGAALREMEAAAANWTLIEQLRADEGNEVRIPCDNGSFEGPSAAITVTASWTNWIERRFEGDNVHACLKAAVEAMRDAEKANG